MPGKNRAGYGGSAASTPGANAQPPSGAKGAAGKKGAVKKAKPKKNT